MPVSETITARDMAKFLARSTARATWWKERTFKGIRMPLSQQYVTALCLRAKVVGFSEPQIKALVVKWVRLHRLSINIDDILPSCIARAARYAERYLLRRAATEALKAEVRAERQASLPRTKILNFAHEHEEFSTERVIEALDLSAVIARKTLSRMVRHGDLDRVARDCYSLAQAQPEPEPVPMTVQEIEYRLYCYERAWYAAAGRDRTLAAAYMHAAERFATDPIPMSEDLIGLASLQFSALLSAPTKKAKFWTTTAITEEATALEDELYHRDHPREEYIPRPIDEEIPF